MSSAFAYGQYAVAIAVSIAVVPMVLARVDLRAYGLWLAASDLLGYVALLDLGVFGVLPWIVAEADGGGDQAAIRRTMSNAFALAFLVSGAYAVVAWGAWAGVPGLLGLTSADRAELAIPLFVVAAGAAVSMPLNVCQAALVGLQDVRFVGATAMARIALNASLTIGLLLLGGGLLAVAAGTAIPPVVAGIAAAVRLRAGFPSLLRDLPRPSPAGMRALAGTAIGAWLGAFGWRLMSMSSGLVLAAVGRPELVPLYSCTARLSAMATQMGWIVPDSGLVGLAQLFGEGQRARLRQIARAMLQLHLIVAGGALTLLLAVNPAFVRWWVTPALYGGDPLNVLLAAGVVVASIAHGLLTIASVLGRRLEIGLVTVANGVLQVGLAWLLARSLGPAGVAAASILAAVMTAIPLGWRYAAERTSTPLASLASGIATWCARAWPAAAAALAVGLWVPGASVWTAVAWWAPIGAAYVWLMRPLYGELPLDAGLRGWLERLRLVPARAGADLVSCANVTCD